MCMCDLFEHAIDFKLAVASRIVRELCHAVPSDRLPETVNDCRKPNAQKVPRRFVRNISGFSVPKVKKATGVRGNAGYSVPSLSLDWFNSE